VKGELGMTCVVRDGYVSPMLCVLDMHRGCTSGSSVSAARTIRGVDVVNKKKLGMEVRGSGKVEHSRRGQGSSEAEHSHRGRGSNEAEHSCRGWELGQRVYPNPMV